MAEENEMKAYMHVRDNIFVTNEDGVMGIDKKSAFGRAHEETIRQGITCFREDALRLPDNTRVNLPDKSRIHLTGNCFESKNGFEYYFNHVKQFCPASPEIHFLEALRQYVDDEQNLPVVLAFSTDSRVDKILETVGFLPLEARI
ncbi:hypothetical protein HY485_03860 [Candidatus Woesearchaeota archaeon]|nr:hypothetical protein [Candidatus Woesearchaeota archaeon]